MSKRLLIGLGAVLIVGLGLSMLRPPTWQVTLLRFRKNEEEVARARIEAVRVLGRTGSAAVPALCEILKDPDARIRRETVRALSDLGEEYRAAIPACSSDWARARR